jgi:hypothetical protein
MCAACSRRPPSCRATLAIIAAAFCCDAFGLQSAHAATIVQPAQPNDLQNSDFLITIDRGNLPNGARFAAFQTASSTAANPTPSNPCKSIYQTAGGDCSSDATAGGHFTVLANTKDCSSVTLNFPNSGDEKFFVYTWYCGTKSGPSYPGENVRYAADGAGGVIPFHAFRWGSVEVNAMSLESNPKNKGGDIVSIDLTYTEPNQIKTLYLDMRLSPICDDWNAPCAASQMVPNVLASGTFVAVGAAETAETVQVKIPSNLPSGTYRLFVGSSNRDTSPFTSTSFIRDRSGK